MFTIFKYELEVVDHPVISMPTDARILSFQSHRDRLCLWALVDTDQPVEDTEFYLRGTGHQFEMDPIHTSFIGSAQLFGGTLVYHLFGPPDMKVG